MFKMNILKELSNYTFTNQSEKETERQMDKFDNNFFPTDGYFN